MDYYTLDQNQRYSKMLRKIMAWYLHQLPFTDSRNYLHIKKFVKYLYGKRVLDVGCGDGNWSFIVSRFCKKVYGIDMNPKAHQIARKKENINYLIANGERIPFKNNSFDFIICTEVLEHIKDEKNIINEFKRILNYGGLIFISTPNKKYFETLDLSAYLKKITPPYLNWFFRWFVKYDVWKIKFGHLRDGYTFEELEKKFDSFKPVKSYSKGGRSKCLLLQIYSCFSPPISLLLYPFYSFIEFLIEIKDRNAGMGLFLLLKKGGHNKFKKLLDI